MQISELNAREAIEKVYAAKSASTLFGMLDEETNGKNRKTVVSEIENALEQFEEKEKVKPVKEVLEVKEVSKPKTTEKKLNRIPGKDRKRF